MENFKFHLDNENRKSTRRLHRQPPSLLIKKSIKLWENFQKSRWKFVNLRHLKNNGKLPQTAKLFLLNFSDFPFSIFFSPPQENFEAKTRKNYKCKVKFHIRNVWFWKRDKVEIEFHFLSRFYFIFPVFSSHFLSSMFCLELCEFIFFYQCLESGEGVERIWDVENSWKFYFARRKTGKVFELFFEFLGFFKILPSPFKSLMWFEWSFEIFSEFSPFLRIFLKF